MELIAQDTGLEVVTRNPGFGWQIAKLLKFSGSTPARTGGDGICVSPDSYRLRPGPTAVGGRTKIS